MVASNDVVSDLFRIKFEISIDWIKKKDCHNIQLYMPLQGGLLRFSSLVMNPTEKFCIIINEFEYV